VNEPDSSYSLRVVNNMLDDLDAEAAQRFGEPAELEVIADRTGRAFLGGLIAGSGLVLAALTVAGWLWKRALAAAWEA
jgi:hypothetical protein